MSEKTIKFIKNVGAMFIANGVSFLISALITFIVPKVLDVESYAYIQLYIFYTSYVSYLHYGWVDGIRLRYGGAYYEDLDKPLFGSQIWEYSILQMIVSFGVILGVSFFFDAGNRKIALLAVGICMLFRLPRLMPQYIMEMSNRIKECARIIIIERGIYLALTCTVIWSGKTSVASLLLCDLAGQAISSAYAFWCCRDLVATKPTKLTVSTKEAWRNVSSGIKLTIANVSSLLIIGIIRMSIENQWDIETFGKISLTISISNLLMVFIRAVAMVMFPTLRRINKDKLAAVYSTMRLGIMLPLLGMLIVYYPLKVVMSIWLPQYAESLKYMALLFPMCIFESKMSMLIETYLKTIRMEGWLLKINLITVSLSGVLAFITSYVLHNLTLAVLSIVILLAFRCVIAETVLSKKMNLDVKKLICLEMVLVAVFIFASWYIDGIAGELVYLAFYLAYLFLQRHEIKKNLKMVKK